MVPLIIYSLKYLKFYYFYIFHLWFKPVNLKKISAYLEIDFNFTFILVNL